MKAQGDAERSELASMIVLRSAWGLGDRALRRVVDGVGSAARGVRRPADVARVLGREKHRPVRSRAEARKEAHGVLARADGAGLRGAAYGSATYPEPLGALSDPPAILWTRGDPALLELPAVAVVGARRATESGRRVAYEIGAGLSDAGFVVVSGLAIGVDGAAHEGALDGGGLTLAVLGSGADRPTPRRHRGLARRIAVTGLIVSEFDPGTDSAPFHFPRRNRVLAGLGGALVVVEAGKRSGALITVDHALDLGRTVYAVPGPIDRPQSAGTNALIRDGAAIVTSVADLVNDLRSELPVPAGVPPRTEAGMVGAASGLGVPDAPPPPMEPEWKALHPLFEDGPMALDALVRKSGLSAPIVAAVILEREVRGDVRAEGARYRRLPR